MEIAYKSFETVVKFMRVGITLMGIMYDEVKNRLNSKKTR